MSLDGKISNRDRTQAEICTNDDYAGRWQDRIDADAILIGANQLRLDDPKLTVKTEERQKERVALGKPKEPIKAAVVSDLSTIKNRSGDFFSTGEKKILFTTKKTSEKELDFFRRLADVYVFGESNVDLKKSLAKLHDLGVKKVMVEGGGELIFSLLKDNLVDEIHLKVGNLILGGRDTVTLVEGNGFGQDEARKVRIVDISRKDNYITLKCKIED
jgi:2,5-diamino-6-(ribosylamino)-4(3H)-pyrimidinone 5'-phosphate reductase